LAPLHRQFATAETACLTLLGAVRDGSNQLRTSFNGLFDGFPTKNPSHDKPQLLFACSVRPV
jgi:hypothetical protein